MSLNERYFNRACELLQQRVRENRMLEDQRHDEVCRKIPEYAQLEAALADTSHDLIITMLNNWSTAPQHLDKLEQTNLAIQQNMSALLKTGGFPEDYLDRIYTCKKCGDKGTYNGNWCECFNRLMLKAAADNINSVSPLDLSSFDNFRLDVYPDTLDASIGASPRAVMRQNFEFCKKYAEEFSPNSRGILMCGGTGLGKTHLSLAIANEVMQKGYNVIYGSIPDLIRALEREHFGKSDENTMEMLTSCDLLILDDLGAETEKPLYLSILYELINSRISRRSPTLINTNLGANDMQQRYQDRLWSRLYSMEVLMFIGKDVRLMMKKN